MKKMMLETKSTLGLAPKTVDPAYDQKASALKAIDRAIRDYNDSVDKYERAMQGVVASLDAVSKAFISMGGQANMPDAMKKVSDDFADMQKHVRDTHYPAFKKALDENGVGALKEMKSAIDECKKLEEARNKVMPEYDTYRDAVSKKEAEYAKKGKDISDSKNYTMEVQKRDQLKTEFDDADTKFKAKFDEVEEQSHTAYLKAAKALIAASAEFMNVFEAEMKDAHSKTKSA